LIYMAVYSVYCTKTAEPPAIASVLQSPFVKDNGIYMAVDLLDSSWANTKSRRRAVTVVDRDHYVKWWQRKRWFLLHDCERDKCRQRSMLLVRDLKFP
jgi:hypothetical protein